MRAWVGFLKTELPARERAMVNNTVRTDSKQYVPLSRWKDDGG
jgi:hypothetical protein